MALTLLIENYQVLDDGGPASINVPEAGLQVGRRTGMGWVLPDASRHISGHHFDVQFQGGEWWLRDMSTNGTYLHGVRHRLDGPHRLEHGDRFQVGQYIIVALMDSPVMVGGMNPASLPSYGGPVIPQETNDDPWSLDQGPALSPVDPLPLASGGFQADFAQDFVAFPRREAGEAASHGAGSAPTPLPGPGRPSPPGEADAQASPFGQSGAAPFPLGSEDDSPDRVVSLTGAAGQPVGADAGAAFVSAFCEGAGLPDDMARGVAPDDLGRALGQAMRIAAGEIMLSLRDRASAKQFVKVGERTMRGASDNNPLKFLPDPEQALETMFLRPRAGFQGGAESIDEALRDLRWHQSALFAALQPALMKLMGDLAPEVIDAETEGGRFGANKKARAWETYVQRWDAKAAPHENGMLDEFISHFASAYRDALSGHPTRRG